MRVQVAIVAVLICGATACFAEEPAPLLSYLSHWEGAWAVSGPDGTKGSLKISADATGRCVVVKGRTGDGGFDEITGYDPQAKAWTTTGFGVDGESYEYRIKDFP